MFELKNITPREYQLNILETCKEKNTLVVLPTGSGKTLICLLLAVHRLNLYPKSKILVVAPTKPLSQQHLISFQKNTNIGEGECVLLTGSISPKKRQNLYENSVVIVATPQTIDSDLNNNRISLEDFSLFCVDEAHKSKERYANTKIAKIYMENSRHPLILALTASPGGNKEKIKEVNKNLFIENVEIRIDSDEDIKKYIQDKNIEHIKLELPEEFQNIKKLINSVWKEKLRDLKKVGFTKPSHLVNKKDLLLLQQRFVKEIKNKNQIAFYGISLTSALIKLNYMIELLECQGLEPLDSFFEKLKKEKSKASSILLAHHNIRSAALMTKDLLDKNIKHPKLIKLLEIVQNEIKLNHKSKIIVFANFRDTVENIVRFLKENKIKCNRFVGQANKKESGLKQREQIEIINRFKEGEFNVLVSSQVAEEGIDVVETKAVIFYEPVPSELRRVQRMGRTARTAPGKIIFLITKDSRDEAYYWSSYHKEKRMKNILKNFNEEKQTKL
ncbi:MAG: DEAD/DEAH box helicase [Nanoarchaeota archaeon]|nr:DEAD/DEAH box helicase [Nanoarchaeota archaeon]